MRRRNSSKRSAKAAELVSESVAGAMTTTGPSSTLKIACSMPVFGCFAGGERWVRAASRVAGLTAEVHPGSQWLVDGWWQAISGLILVPVTILTDQRMNLPGRAAGPSRRVAPVVLAGAGSPATH